MPSITVYVPKSLDAQLQGTKINKSRIAAAAFRRAVAIVKKKTEKTAETK